MIVGTVGILTAMDIGRRGATVGDGMIRGMMVIGDMDMAGMIGLSDGDTRIIIIGGVDQVLLTVADIPAH